MKCLCLVALAGALASPAFATGKLADVSIVDRETGETLAAHRFRGEYWVAGRPGARYAISIRSRTGQRLLAVTSVDGVNVITGETAAFDQRGYVFDPWVGYEITGWRKSNAEVAAFTFTSVPQSYASRTGRAENVGVIGVALFREHVPAPAPATESAADAAVRSNEARRERAPAAQSLGTGHGQRESSAVVSVAFEREQSRPNETIRIRYDSRENLVAMGVIRQPPPAQRRPEAFPEDTWLGYVPDP